MVGNATHQMTHQRGQGPNHSIIDAGRLNESLSAPTQSQSLAIDNYEAGLKARTAEEVRLSVIITTVLHDWTKVLESPVI